MELNKKIVFQNMDEIARIHAHISGDGCVYTKNSKRSPRSLLKHPRKKLYQTTWVIEYTNTCRGLLEEFNRDMKVAFNRKGQWASKYHRIRVDTVKWILELLELKGKNSYNWNIPKYILNSNKKVISTWIRAFFDDESTVTNTGMIRVKSVNKAGLSQVRELLYRFGIETRLTGPNCDNTYYLSVYKRCGPIYQKYIGFNHPAKKEKIHRIISGSGAI